MTIKELCNKYEHCNYCPFSEVCPYQDYWENPLSKLNDEDNETVTKSIIETARILQEDKNV